MHPVTAIRSLIRGVALSEEADFRWFWFGQTLSIFGSQVSDIALPLIAAVTLGAGAGGVSLVAAAMYVPNLVLPLLVGHWLESRRRRPIMIGADILRSFALLTVPLAFFTSSLSVPLLALVALTVGAADVVFEIGRFTYIPSIVAGPRLAHAIGPCKGRPRWLR